LAVAAVGVLEGVDLTGVGVAAGVAPFAGGVEAVAGGSLFDCVAVPDVLLVAGAVVLPAVGVGVELVVVLVVTEVPGAAGVVVVVTTAAESVETVVPVVTA
jgi:hypothetical protein